MPWWPKRGGQAGSGESATDRGDGAVRVELPSPRSPEPTEALVETVDITRLAAALDRLEIRYLTDGDGSLLDHSILMYGSGMSDSNLHLPENLPTMLLGGGAGQLKGGRHIKYPKGTPFANLHLTLLEKLGLRMEQFGNSTGALELLAGV